MKKYKVSIIKRIDYYGEVVVEADDEAEAMSLADDAASSGKVNFDSEPDVCLVPQDAEEV